MFIVQFLQGTFGGPASYFTDPGIGGISKVLDNRGILAGKAETTTSIPSFGNVGNCPPACFVTQVFRWDKGLLTDLGALPGGDSSDIGGINARGGIVGCSTTGEIDPLLDAPLCHAALWKGNEVVDLGTLRFNWLDITCGNDSSWKHVVFGLVQTHRKFGTLFDPRQCD